MLSEKAISTCLLQIEALKQKLIFFPTILDAGSIKPRLIGVPWRL
jgi:hypothetical protein